MTLVSAETVRRCLRDLSDERFAAFVSGLWDARGAETRVRPGGRVVDIRRAGQTRTLGVVTGRRVPADVTDADILVLSRPASTVRGTAEFGGRVVDADDLHAMVLYAVPRATADDLCRRFFGRPLVTESSSMESVVAHAPEHSASLVVGLLGVVLVVAGVFGGPMLYGDNAAVFGAPESVGADPTADVETAEPTSTSSAIDDDSLSYESISFPPGLGPSGVTDHDLVADTHAKAVTGRSYRLTITHREYVDGLPTAYRRETVSVAAPTVYRTELEGAGRLERSPLVVARVEAFADGETHYQRRVVADEFDRAYTIDPEPVRGVRNGEGRYADRAEQYVGWFLSVEESEVVDTFEREETRYYWVRLGQDTYTGIENSSGSALVDDNGVVHEIRRQYDYPGEGNVSAVVALRYTDFGTTTVSPPAWHDAMESVTAETTTLESGTTENTTTQNATAQNTTAASS